MKGKKLKRQLIFFRGEHGQRMTKEQLLELYNIIVETTSKMSLETQLSSIDIFYDILGQKDIKNDPDYMNILKDILIRFKESINKITENKQSYEESYEFFQEEYETFSRK